MTARPPKAEDIAAPGDGSKQWSKTRARILVVITSGNERRLLADWLGKVYQVEAPDPKSYPVSKAIFEQAFDLVILDGPALKTQENLIRLLREKEQEVFMPLLLVTSRQSVTHATENLWRLIDDILLKPIEKAELYARVEILMRARYYSLKLQERYYGLAELAPVGILVIDRHGTIRYANEHAHRIFVDTSSYFIGRSVDEPWDFFDVGGGYLPRHERPFARIIGSREPLHDVQLAYRNPAGAEYRLSVSGVPITSEDNDIESVLLVAKDVTAQVKQAEELRRARDRAEEMSRLKTAFLANMSHEIRTPLTGILSSAEILSDETAGELREIAELITVSADRLRRTLESVLDLAQLESSTWRFTNEVTGLAHLVDQAVSDCRRSANERNVDIITDVQGGCTVKQDRDALKRIVDNLLSNAVKFTQDGRVYVRVNCTETSLTIEVEDEGIGISPDFIPHIFEEFKQESVGFARDFEGSGLGLTIAERLATLLGGYVQVESTKGEGSTFRVILPPEKPKDGAPVGFDEPNRPNPTGADRRIAAANAYYRIFDNNPFPCIILDAESHVIWQANRAVRFYGYTNEELVGRPFSDICTMNENLLAAHESEAAWGRWNVRSRDGTYRSVLAIFYPLQLEEDRCTVVHLLDDEPVPDTNFVRAERLRQLQILQSFSTRIAAAKVESALHRTVDETMREAFDDIETLALWSYDPDEDRLQLAAASGPRDETELKAFCEYPEFKALLEADEIQTEYADAGISDPFASSRTFAHAQSVTVVPLRAAGKPMALLVLAGTRAEDSGRYVERQMMQAFATLAAMVIQRLRLINRLKEASRLLMDAQESERRVISQDIHDEIGGLLSSLQLLLKMVKSEDPSIVDDLQEATQVVDELIAHIRDLSFRLSPPMLPDLGLIPTVRSYATRYTARSRIAVTLQDEIDPESRYPQETESTAFRVIQESLTNASKHAQAETIQIHVREDQARLVIHVIDDGVGFDPDALSSDARGMGLRGLEERVQLVDGEIDIVSAPGEGTRISVALPVGSSPDR